MAQATRVLTCKIEHHRNVALVAVVALNRNMELRAEGPVA